MQTNTNTGKLNVLGGRVTLGGDVVPVAQPALQSRIAELEAALRTLADAGEAICQDITTNALNRFDAALTRARELLP